MQTATADSPAPSLDLMTLLARINARIAMLRAWLSHDHGDEPYWWARAITPPCAQSERNTLRQVANLLHVERATARGRLHGTRFPTLDDQRRWLADHESRRCAAAADYARVPRDATLLALREGKLPA